MPFAAAPAATHAELAGLIARGDRRRAAALLVRDHASAVLALCRSMVRDARAAEDLSQDAFARAFGALEGFRGEASPRTWLLRIARNRCLDHLDRARRAPWLAGGDPDPEPDAHAAAEPPPYDLLTRREDAARAMAVLGEPERALVVLHFGHGVGYPELADAFSLREGTVRMRISRALARMRAALASEGLAEAADFEVESPTVPRGSRAATSEAARGRASSAGAEAAADDLDAATAATVVASAPDGLDLDEWDSTVASAPPVSTSTGDLDELAQTAIRVLFGDLDAADPAADLSSSAGAAAAAPSAFAVPSAAGPMVTFSSASSPASPSASPSVSSPTSPPTFSALHDEAPPALRDRLDALAAAL